MAFIGKLLYCGLSFCVKLKMGKYWELSLSNRHTRYLTFRVIHLLYNDNDSYYMAALQLCSNIIKIWKKRESRAKDSSES